MVTDPRVAPRRHRRLRRACFAVVEALARLFGGRAFYRRRQLSAGRFLLRREFIPVRGLPQELDGFRIAQLSDLHAGPFLGAGDLADVAAAIRTAAPDLLVITGDLCAQHPEQAFLVLDDLAEMVAPCGALGVFGNHDYKDRREAEIAARFAERGIRFLRNEGFRVRREGRDLPLVVTGLEDLEEGRGVGVAAARQSLRAGDVEILLCHNPRGARVLAREGCAAILSGHTHGTQVDLPWLRGLGPDHPGLRVDFGSTSLVVSRGLGVVGAPLRVGVPAEVVLLELGPATESDVANGASHPMQGG